MNKTVLALPAIALAAGAIHTARKRDWELPQAPGTVVEIDGEHIHYVESGRGPAIVLIHGFGQHTFEWRELIPLLDSDHRVVALDLPGFGFSDRGGDLAYTFDRHAQRVVALMDELGIDRAVIVGHSMGGLVAQHLAVGYPGRVEGLALVATLDAGAPLPWKVAPGFLGAANGMMSSGMFALPRLLEWSLRRSFLRLYADDSFVTDEVVRASAGPLLFAGTAKAIRRLIKQTGEEEPVDLGTIHAPAVVLTGDEDPLMTDKVGPELAAKIPGARHISLPSTGHMLPEERPHVLAREVRTLSSKAAAADSTSVFADERPQLLRTAVRAPRSIVPASS